MEIKFNFYYWRPEIEKRKEKKKKVEEIMNSCGAETY